MASNQKGNQPFRPSRLSHLRQEITLDVNDDECTRTEAEIQVPDSQVVIPETQFDLLDPPTCPDEVGNALLISNAIRSVQPQKYDDNFLSRVQVSRKATRPDPMLTVNLLQRPEERNEISFSPFTHPNRATNATQGKKLHTRLHSVIDPEQLHSSDVLENESRADETAEIHDVSKSHPFPGPPVLSTDEQGLPIVTTQLVPPRIDEGGALQPASSKTLGQPQDEQPILVPTANLAPLQDGSERVPLRRKGKKSKKGRRRKSHQPESPAVWPENSYQQTQDGVSHHETGGSSIQYMESTGSQGHSTTQNQSDRVISGITRDRQGNDFNTGQNSTVMQTVVGTNPLAEVVPAASEVIVEPPGHIPAQDRLGIVSPTSYGYASETGSSRLQIQPQVKEVPIVKNHENTLMITAACGADLQLTMTTDENLTYHGCGEVSQGHEQTQIEGTPDTQISGAPGIIQGEAFPSYSAYTAYVQNDVARHPPMHQERFDQHDRVIPSQIQALSHENILHEKSVHGGPNRVKKPRVRKRSTGNSNDLTSRLSQHVYPGTDSEEQDAIVNAISIFFRAGDAKTRSIVEANSKAYEATIASLQDLIVQQKSLIDSLQSENGELKAKVDKTSKSTSLMQKYVNEMKDDYTRLKTQSETHYQTYRNIVERKVEELEDEKTAMQHDLSKTLEAHITSQRNMKNVMNDCLTQVQLTESRLEVAFKTVHYQSILYDDAKDRRIELEKQVLPTLESIKRILGHQHTDISQNLQVILSTTSDKSSENKQDIDIRQCLDAVRSLKEIPVLTTKDSEKAVAMLRYVHKSIDEKVSKVAQAVNGISNPAIDIQAHLADELASLGKDVLKYDEMVHRHQKAEVAKLDLTQQLNAQKEQNVKLEEAYRNSQQEEANLKAQLLTLQNELNVSRAEPRNKDSGTSELEHEIGSLRQQVNRTEGDLHMRLTELGRARYELEHQALEIATIKATFKEQEAALQQNLANHEHERDSSNQLINGLQEQKRNMADRLKVAQNKIQEMEARIEELQGAGVKLQNDLENAQSKADTSITLSNEVNRLNIILKTRSEDAQVLATKIDSISSEKAKLEEQLQGSTKAFRRKEDEHHQLQEHDKSLKRKALETEREVHDIRYQFSKKESELSDLQQRIGVYVKDQEKTAGVLKQLQECEKQLESLQTRDEAIRKSQMSFDQRTELMEQEHIAECRDLKQRVAQLEGMVRENEKALEHKTRELEAHREITDQKFQQLVQEAVQHRNMVVENTQQNSSRDPRLHGRLCISLTDSISPHHDSGTHLEPHNLQDDSGHGMQDEDSSPDTKWTKLRKKPNRMNTTVLQVTKALKNQLLAPSRRPEWENLSFTGHEVQGDETRFSPARVRLESGSHGLVNELDGKSCEFDRERTQESGQPMSPVEKSVPDAPPFYISSSPLSDPLSSDGLIDMAPLDQITVPAKTTNARNRSEIVDQDASRNSFKSEKSAHLHRNAINLKSPQSGNRPRSQANTGSRIDPYHATHRMLTGSQFPSNSLASSMHLRGGPLEPNSPQSSTYGYQANDVQVFNKRLQEETDHSPPRSALSKRSFPDEHVHEHFHVKRHRESAQFVTLRSLNLSLNEKVSHTRSQSPIVVPTPPNHHHRSRKDSSSVVGSQVKHQAKTRPAHAPTMAPNRSSRARGKKREDDFDAVFNREIGSREHSRRSG